MRGLLVLTFAILTSVEAYAGFIELGVSGTYKRTNISTDSFDESRSLTGSMSYLFDDMSAVEFSYTGGESKRYIGSTSGNGHTTQLTYRMAGVDFVLNFGARDAMLRPYIKLGVAHIFEKRLSETFDGFPPSQQPEDKVDTNETVPSAGIGFKLMLTKSLAFKFGVEAWTSRSFESKPRQIDYAGRAGLSWIF
jgi:hypothetical protein